VFDSGLAALLRPVIAEEFGNFVNAMDSKDDSFVADSTTSDAFAMLSGSYGSEDPLDIIIHGLAESSYTSPAG
jgi:hypothetical protein